MMKSLFLLLLFISCIQITATNRYIAKTGNDSNTGTINTPFLTIQRGLEEAHSGDTVFVKTGIYQESVKFSKSGTLGHPIVLKCYKNDIVTIDAQNTRIYCIYISQNNLVVDGINCENSINYNIKVEGCENIEIKNLSSSLPIGKSKNVVIVSSSDNWSRNIKLQNIITYGGIYGLLLGDRINGLAIMGGKYSYASVDGINLQSGSITDSARFNRNIILDGTEVDHNTRQGIVTMSMKSATFKNFWSHHNGATGIQIENLSSKILIEDFLCENNSLTGGFETGVWIDDSDSVTVRRGIMRNNQCGFRVSNSNNILAYNLLIYSNNYFKAPPNVNNSSGINFYTKLFGKTNNLYVSHVELYNSIIYNNSNNYSQRGTVVLQGLGTYILKNNIIALGQSPFDIYRTGTHTLISNNNLIYNTKELNIYYNPHELSTYPSSLTWSSYKRATGQDSLSINEDPKFVDAENNDFRLKSNSPFLSVNTNSGLTTNFGKPINSGSGNETYDWIGKLFKRFNINGKSLIKK